MTMTVNVGEFGVALSFNTNYNMSAYTSLALKFTRADRSSFTGVPSLGTVDLATTDAGTYLANQYVLYLFADGDLTVPGEYLVRLVYTDAAPKRLISDPTSFIVSP